MVLLSGQAERLQPRVLSVPTPERRRRADVVPLDVARKPAGPRDEVLETTTRLRYLRCDIGASSVVLIRFDLAQGTFEVVAATGRPLLAAGVRLPVGSSSLVLAASEGRRLGASLDTSVRPVDRLAATVGIGAGAGIPLTLGGSPIGAVLALWEAEGPRPLAIHNQAELMRILLTPAARDQGVLVCHEHPLEAGGLARLLESYLQASVSVAKTVEEARASVSLSRPDLVILSDQLSPGERLVELAADLRAAGSAAPFILMTRAASRRSFDNAVRAGASGYLPIAAASSELATIAGAVLRGESALQEHRVDQDAPRLTEREHDVLLCFNQGLSDKEIAHRLGVAISTVKTHARAMYGKLRVASRTAALHEARRTGLI